MRMAAPQERRDHDTTLHRAAALLLPLLATLAFPAQQAAAQAAPPCTAIADDAERLACYDRALRGAAPPAAAPAPAAPAPRSAPPVATPEPAAPASAAAASRSERRVREPAREATAPPAPAAPAAPRAARNDEPEIVPIVVVSTRALPGRETTFTANDGTRWVQTDGQRITGLPDTPFDAEIKPGAMGSYFLVAKDRPRAIRVRPVR